MRSLKKSIVATIAGLSCTLSVSVALVDAQPVDFQKEIAPILMRRCLECHHPGTREGGLDLSTAATLTTGGDSGAVVTAGKPDESYLWQRVVAGEMPPADHGESARLPDAELTRLKRWIEAGAAWPADVELDLFATTTDKRAGRDWWSLQPVRRPEIPTIAASERVASPIDALVLARLAEHGMTMAPPADRRTLIRRAYLDLWGLPPSPEEVAAFVADDEPDSFERLLDHLLASPHYGQRWARHWLDVVRFAESCGYERDQLKPNIWKYRDWVIRAINDDMPYDRFVTDQLAGDEVPWRDEQSVIATGMLRAGTWNDEPNDPADYLYERLEDMVHVTSSAFLGLTVKCARCHDHKFDPIRQTDYYALASFFWAGHIGQENLGGPSTEQLGYDVFGWTDRSRDVEPIRLLVKGERHRPGPEIEPRFLSAVEHLDRPLQQPPAESTTTRRRLQLARWITDRSHPLTARVFVNRLWQHHFGHGLVRSSNNFGFKSDPPTHPKLLDWLAAELMEGGWTIKRMHKMLMLSSVYRQQSHHPQQAICESVDFENRLLWRQHRRRLEAESLRDAMLVVNGQLNPQVGGESFYPRMSEEALEGLSRKGAAWGSSSLPDRLRRSVYMMTRRSRLLPLMKTFDFCDTTLPCGQRDVTTVAPQALALMNNKFVHEQSRAFARRLANDVGPEAEAQVLRAWRLALGRSPSGDEVSAAIAYLNEQQSAFEKLPAERLIDRPPHDSLPVRSDLRLWLKSDAGVQLDEQGRVMFWSDQAQPDRQIAFDGSQPHGDHRPLFSGEVDGWAGRPVVTFGEKRFLRLAGQTIQGPQFTILAVVTDRSPEGERSALLSNYRGDRRDTAVYLGSAGQGKLRVADGELMRGSFTSPAQPSILTVVHDGRALKTLQNQNLLAATSPLAARNLHAPYVLGTQGDSQQQYWSGELGELLVYGRALYPQELEEVHEYLGRRYQLFEAAPPDARHLALASLCQVLFSTNEFIYVD